MVVAGLLSIGLHALAVLSFNDRAPPMKRILVPDEPVIQMTMPELEKDEVEPVEDLGEEPPAQVPSIAVPLLADLPSLVPIDAFVQPLDFTPALRTDIDAVSLSAVPVNIARSNTSMEKLGRIFNVAELDRQPHPTFRPSPVFPPDMKKEFTESSVEVEFIVSSKGEVFAPRILSSQHRRFEDAALRAIEKWKFRPGYKTGRPVNTRTRITIIFKVTPDS